MRTKLFLTFIFIIIYFSSTAQSPSWLWAKSAGGAGVDAGLGISTDASGNVFVTGYFDTTSITFGTTTLNNAGHQDMFIVKYDPAGNVLWAKSAGGTGFDRGFGLATDNNGNVLITGDFSSPSITFGTTTLTNAGFNDFFIVKYDPSGNVLWAKSAGGTSLESGTSISTDASGNIAVCGEFDDTITFGTTSLISIGSRNIFTVKYDPSGNVIWAKSGGGTGYDFGNGIAFDANGNILVTGTFDSPSVAFGTTTLTSAGSNDIFIVKYDASGNIVWAKSEGGTDADFGTYIATDSIGNILVSGHFRSLSITFGTSTFTNAGLSDIFITKYDSSGNVLWAKAAGGSGDDVGFGNSFDKSGNALATGVFGSSSITFGTTVLPNAGTASIFIVKYDALGNVIWAKSAGGTGGDTGYGIAADVNGNVLITGFFLSPSITFGATTITNAGLRDIFIAKLDNVTGIPEINNSFNEINIFTDPSNIFTVEVNANQINACIEIYNALGEKFYSENLKNKEQTINCSRFSKGIYFVKVTDGEKIYARKFLVQ